MSEELQQEDNITFDDEVIEEVQEEPQAEPESETSEEGEESEGHDDGSASATDDTDKDRAVEYSEEQRRHMEEKIIAPKVFKLRETERERDKLKEELEALRKSQTPETPPDVPAVPDAYSLSEQEYQAKLRERDEAIRKKTEWDARQKAQEEQRQQAEQQAAQERYQAIQEAADVYSSRAKKLGVSESELQAAAQNITRVWGDDLNPLSELILQDEEGPLITKYLGSNVSELEEVTALYNRDPYQAAIRLATTVKTKASALKPKVSKKPDPLRTPRNSGTPASETLDGVTFE